MAATDVRFAAIEQIAGQGASRAPARIVPSLFRAAEVERLSGTPDPSGVGPPEPGVVDSTPVAGRGRAPCMRRPIPRGSRASSAAAPVQPSMPSRLSTGSARRTSTASRYPTSSRSTAPMCGWTGGCGSRGVASTGGLVDLPITSLLRSTADTRVVHSPGRSALTAGRGSEPLVLLGDELLRRLDLAHERRVGVQGLADPRRIVDLASVARPGL